MVCGKRFPRFPRRARRLSRSFLTCPLSLFLAPPRRRTYSCVRVCVYVYAVYIRTLCVRPPKAQVSRSGEGHRRRWTARDAARREPRSLSLFLAEIETARPPCVFSYIRADMRASEVARDKERRCLPSALPSSSRGERASDDDISESLAPRTRHCVAREECPCRNIFLTRREPSAGASKNSASPPSPPTDRIDRSFRINKTTFRYPRDKD